jgi:hypothetical protein
VDTATSGHGVGDDHCPETAGSVDTAAATPRAGAGSRGINLLQYQLAPAPCKPAVGALSALGTWAVIPGETNGVGTGDGYRKPWTSTKDNAKLKPRGSFAGRVPLLPREEAVAVLLYSQAVELARDRP